MNSKTIIGLLAMVTLIVAWKLLLFVALAIAMYFIVNAATKQKEEEG